MRRLPKELRETGPKTDPRKDSGVVVDLCVPLRFLTPIVGGGSRVHCVDPLDPIRVPSLRGALRAWWRALGNEPTPQQLLRNEGSVWGAVAQSGADDSANRRSCVDVLVGRVDPPKTVVPGFHERQGGGRFKFPKWERDYRELSYALFPLQRTRGELQNAAKTGAARLDLHPVRVGGGFELRVRLRYEVGATDGQKAKAKQGIDRLLGAVWMWITFGGYGARTSRGFGAVGIVGQASGVDLGDWSDRFVVPQDIEAWKKQVAWVWRRLKLSEPVRIKDRTILPGATVLAARFRDSSAAHSKLVDALGAFRQKVDFARDPPNQPRRPGQSRWPEPSTAKQIADRNGHRERWPHAPFTRPSDPLAAPRAVFGLPLLLQFKDRDEKKANGQFQPIGKGNDRFKSPLRMSVVGCEHGVVAVTLTLAHRPEKVEYVIKHHRSASIEVNCSVGARGPILQALGHRGDALAAFENFLGKGRNPFKKVV